MPRGMGRNFVLSIALSISSSNHILIAAEEPAPIAIAVITIIASKKKAYSHILKHKFNCFLTQSNNIQEWVKTVKKVLSMPSYIQSIQKNSIQTAVKYSWLKRAEKIIKFKDKT